MWYAYWFGVKSMLLCLLGAKALKIPIFRNEEKKPTSCRCCGNPDAHENANRINDDYPDLTMVDTW